MRRSFVILMFMFLLNATVGLTNSLPIFGGESYTEPYNNTQLTEALNGTELGQNWDPPESGGLFGDVKAFITSLEEWSSFMRAVPNIIETILPWMPAAFLELFEIVWVVTQWILIGDLISGGKIFGT
jgi:hypothetical protein